MTATEPHRVTWEGRGRQKWIAFGHGLRAHVQLGPMRFNLETVVLPEREPVSLIRAGELQFSIKPHHTLVIPDHRDPGTWYVI